MKYIRYHLENKILPSGIVIDKFTSPECKYCWLIAGTHILHNEGSPALEYFDGEKYYISHGKCHRLDGPAIIFGKNNQFYINGKNYREKEYWYLINNPELLAFV